jgi:hypothetical protein
MPVGFTRRVIDTPSIAFLLAIEGVVIIDRPPPNLVQGVNTNEVEIFCECEDGPFGVHTKINSSGDLATFGLATLGYAYNGVAGNNPSARGRKSDGAANFEYWNGNGFIALVNKRFGGLTVYRVDTSVGSVSFSREAWLTGKSDFSFKLTSGQILQVDVGAGNVACTFTGVVATILSGVGVYASTFAGGEQITFKLEGVTYQAFFLSSDQTQAQVIARLNLAAGYAAFVDAGGGRTRVNGSVKGTAGSVQIVAIDALVATATGFAAGAAVVGTGNVPNIDAVKDADASAVVTAAVAAAIIDRDASGNLRLVNKGTPLTGTIKVDAISTATAFGFPTNTVASAAVGVDGVIPAGTRVRTGGAIEFVTMQSIAVTKANAGPYVVKVRHALDDGTGVSQNVSTLTVMPFPIAAGAFAVTNNNPINAALTEAAIDAAYVTGIASSSATSKPTKTVSVQVSARQSNAIRSALKAIGPTASDNGCNGRMAVVRPPLGTTRATALSTVAQPGVGTYRDNVEGRTIYAFPGVNTFIPQIAALGTAGGAGFTSDGNIDVGFDTWIASVVSQLNPEENPGQLTAFLALINGVELGNADVQNLQMSDYIAFKAAGIAAYRQDDGDNFIQSGITTSDPATASALVPISRRRMADFIEDSGAAFLMSYVKKLARVDRKAAAISGLTAFLEQLKSTQNPALSRIADYAIDAKSANTATTKKQGIFWIIGQVVLLGSLDVIVFDAEIGQTVTINVRQ